MKGKLIWSIFWAMVGVLVIVFGIMVIGPPRLPHGIYLLVLLPFIAVFFLLGVTLLVLTVKRKVEGKLRRFLQLTGVSIAGLATFRILHDVIIVSGILNKVGGANPDEPFFWFLSFIVCPIGFVVGVVGTIVFAIKTKWDEYSSVKP